MCESRGRFCFRLIQTKSTFFSTLTWNLCVFCRQHLTPCEAELTLSGQGKIKSNTSNYWVGHMIEGTNHIFTGGLPQNYLPNQVRFWPFLESALWKSHQADNQGSSLPSQRAEPFHNYTGCIHIVEINKLTNFGTSDAVAGSNVGQCRWNLRPVTVVVKFCCFRVKYFPHFTGVLR